MDIKTILRTTSASKGDVAFMLLQRALPTRFLSWVVFKISRAKAALVKSTLIRLFISHYKISLDEAERERPGDYENFNDFFTRSLKMHARPVDRHPKSLVSPVDGTVSQLGNIRDGMIMQAKGHQYSALDLLGGDQMLGETFKGGAFATIYLAPYNYHRIHMPLTGTLKTWLYIPGRLFSVNASTVRAMPQVFALNERIVSIFDTDAGPFGIVMVGALFVGSMETVWSGLVTPPHRRSLAGIESYEPYSTTTIGKGFEMGRFNMGSTVILLGPPGRVGWGIDIHPGKTLRVGEAIGQWT